MCKKLWNTITGQQSSDAKLYEGWQDQVAATETASAEAARLEQQNVVAQQVAESQKLQREQNAILAESLSKEDAARELAVQASLPIEDSEPMRQFREQKLRKLMVGGGAAARRGLDQLGAAPVGFRLLTGQ